MHFRFFSRSLALTLVLGAVAAQQACAQKLNLNGLGSQIKMGGGYTMTSMTPVFESATSVSSIPLSPFYNAFTQWNATKANNAKWSMVLYNTAQYTFNLIRYNETITAAGVGDLVCDISYTPDPTNPGGAPPPISRVGPIPSTAAVWSQSVLTTDPINGAFPGGMSGYLDCKAAYNNAPAYPYQYVTSEFWDDPSRTGNPNRAVNWQGDAYLTTVNYSTRTLTVFGGVEWGFTITPNAQAQLDPPNNDDLGPVDPNLPQAVPEPAPPIVLGVGIVGLLIRRKRSR